jgi:hypothetical protein
MVLNKKLYWFLNFQNASQMRFSYCHILPQLRLRLKHTGEITIIGEKSA